jgi:hypothetical protein
VQSDEREETALNPFHRRKHAPNKSRVYISVDTTTPSETRKVSIEIEANAPYQDLLKKAKEMAER